MGAHIPGFARALADTPRALVGTWIKLPSLESVEILARSGLDFAVIDMEHAPIDLGFAYAATVVAQGLGMQVLVRVPDRSGSHLQRLLDSGVDGILVPRVSGAQEASEAVRAMTFSPDGERGNGSTSRAGQWGGVDRETYLERGEHVLRAVQLEDRGALADAAAIVALPQLNGVFLGMGDLQLSSRLSADSDELQTLVTGLLDTSRARGVPVGTAVQTAAQAAAAIRRGFSYVMVDNDAGMLRRSAEALAADVRRALDD